MKTIEELLKNLGRPEVLEFGLVTNRLPSVNIGGKFEPVDDEAPTTDNLLQMLISMGGSRYVEQLSERPVQWTTRLEGVGVIAVAAIMRKDVVQARFTVARRDAGTGRSQSPGPMTPSAAPPRPSQNPQPAAVAAIAAVQGSQPGIDFRRTQQGTGGPQPQLSQPPPVPHKPSLSPPTGVIAIPVKTPSGSASVKAAVPPPDDWDDDDEPTVQTLSPPVANQGGPGEDGKAKPARTPGELIKRDTTELPAQQAPRPDAGAAQRKAAEERAAAERKAAEERKAADERAAAERKAVEERAAAERKAAEERKAADERKIQERIAAERAASERAAAEQRAAMERAAAERKVAEERAAAERKLQDRTKVERRISTPTSVDVVDVDIAAVKKTAVVAPAGRLEIDIDPVDATVEVTSPAPTASRPVTAAMPSHAVPSAVPSTTPSALVGPEKDRPRADGALHTFLGMAIAARASDIHIVAGRPVLLRVATDLLPRTEPVLAEHVERIVREIVPARLRETLETDGSCDFAIEHPQHGRFRANVSRQRTGYKLSMRVVPRDVPTLASLALPEAVGAAAKYPQGLVLVTGPTGHGKTTTLAAIVDILNRDTAHHILTIEDPIEFTHPRKRGLISHREIGTHARTFASALAASRREDPDVVVVGELQDAETVRLAIAASEMGQLVIGTMNTGTAAKTIDRILDMFPTSEQPQLRASLAGVLRLIIGQRLVPSADRTRLHAAVEMLPSSIALYTLIRDARTFQIPSLQQRGRALGVVRLDESLADLVRAQKVTLEVAKQFAESPQELEAHVTRSAPAASARKA